MSDRATAVLRAVVLAVVAPVVGLGLVVLGQGDDAAAGDAVRHLVLAAALVVYSALLLLRAARAEPAERPAWLVATAVAPVSSVVVVTGEHGAEGWGAAARGAVCLLLLAALALVPGVRRRADQALVLVLEGWALTAGAFALILLLAARTGALPRGDGGLGAQAPLVAVWLLLDLVVLALLVGLMRRSGRVLPLLPFAVSMAAMTAADTLTWRGGLTGWAAVGSDACWVVAVLSASAGAIGTGPILRPAAAEQAARGTSGRAVRSRASDTGVPVLQEESGTWVPAVATGVVVGVTALDATVSGRAEPELVVLVLTLVAAVIAQVALLLRDQAGLARRLHDTSTRYRTIVEGSTDVVFVCDADGVARFVSPASRTVLGLPPRELEGRELVGLAHEADRADLAGVLHRARSFAGPVVEIVDQVRVARSGGGWRHVELRVQPHDTAAVPGGLTLVMRDVSERVRMQRELERRARLDALTGLPNRWWFTRTLADRLAAGKPTSVVFVDLDEFKAVNDTEGHAVGDRLLVAAARRLRFAVGEDDTVGRLSGDEFAVVVCDDRVERVRVLAEAVLEEIAAPFAVGSRRVRIAASVGIAVAGAGQDADTVLRDADLAMYAAKRSGGHRVVLSHPDQLQAVVDRTAMDRRVRAAAEDDDFELVYQPIVDMRDGRVVAVEALLRWPGSGVSPTDFVPRLEESGLIVEVGGQVLARAVDQAARWWREGRPAGISVNLSSLQVSDPDLVCRVREVLAESGLPPERLTLEVTEGLLLRDLDAAVTLLGQLREAGVRVALDDFGTGYSSLAYLHRLPIDVLKVDRSFVRAAVASERDQVVLRAIVALGRELGLTVVAEGVQETAQVQLLLSLGCTVAQGFLLAAPSRPEDVPEVVELPVQLRPQPRPAGDPPSRVRKLVGMRDDVPHVETDPARS
jgi:diguanylate cyclase (GGDEF)-like protein/PAS domain S-box-containing protein